MITLSPATQAKLVAIARIKAPAEACGVLAIDTVEPTVQLVLPVQNLAPDPTQEFWIDPKELKAITDYWNEGYTVCLWHSHPDGRPDPSLHDFALMRQTNVPMLIVGLKPVPAVAVFEFQGAAIVETSREKEPVEA